MSGYIFSSELRRAAERILSDTRAPLTVAVVGDQPRETLLFRNVAFHIEKIDADDMASFAEHGFILCGLVHLPDLIKSLETRSGASRASITPDGFAIRGPIGALTAGTWRPIETLCEQLGFALVGEHTDIVDFGHDKEIVLILARTAAMGGDDPLRLLKLAVFFEAYSLFDAASALLNRYNERISGSDLPAIDPAVIDRVYDLGPSDISVAAVGDAALQSDQSEGEGVSQRLLSVHFDQLHRDDGADRLRYLAGSLALPDQVEIVVRIPAPQPFDEWQPLVAELAELGVEVKAFRDNATIGQANPAAPGFLAMTGPAVALAVYYGEVEPDVPGWDFDLLRVAESASTRMFSLRISGHKTRNYFCRQDAEIAPEGLPTVSRAWLEACGAWSDAEVPASVFQTLVAFFYDRTDWTNKHRPLNLRPVMTLSSRPAADTTETPTRPQGRVSFGTRRRAIEAALKLHALDWGAGQGIEAPTLECGPLRRRLVMRAATKRQVMMSWKLPRDRIRLPL